MNCSVTTTKTRRIPCCCGVLGLILGAKFGCLWLNNDYVNFLHSRAGLAAPRLFRELDSTACDRLHGKGALHQILPLCLICCTCFPQQGLVTVNTLGTATRLALLPLTWALLLLVALCYTSTVYSKGLPAWFQTPPSDNADTLFGIGQGTSLQTATQSALESIAGKIMTEVESDMTIATQVQDNVANSQVASQVRSQVAKTNLANYTVEAQQKDGKDFYVLVKVNQKAVWQANQDALKELEAEIDAYFDDLQSKSTLSVSEDQSAITDKIHLARSKALISRSLNPNYDHTTISNKLRGYQDRLKKKVANNAIYITGSADLKALAQRVANQLTNEGYTVTLTPSNNNATVIYLEGSFREYDQFNQKHVTARAVIRVTDEFKKPIYTKEVVLNGSSLMSYDSAKTIAVNRYLKELELDGAAASFGLSNK